MIAAEYASVRWLEINSPNYRQVVAEELTKLRDEIIASKDQIGQASGNSTESNEGSSLDQSDDAPSPTPQEEQQNTPPPPPQTKPRKNASPDIVFPCGVISSSIIR